jgi:beta-lactam-binding protein with PASTA domain
MLFLALLCVFAAVVIAAVVIATGTSNTVVHFQEVVAKDAQSAINQIQSLISKYTK